MKGEKHFLSAHQERAHAVSLKDLQLGEANSKTPTATRRKRHLDMIRVVPKVTQLLSGRAGEAADLNLTISLIKSEWPTNLR